MKFESEKEIIKHKNDGQECDQCGKWICNVLSLKTHKKREHEITSEEGKKARKYLRKQKKRKHEISSKKGSKDKDKETQVMEIECEKCNEKFESVEKLIEHVREIECVKCNEKFVSVNKFIEHVNENECVHCGKWLCCGTYLRKHKKKDHEITSEEGSKEEENKKDSNEDEEKDEVGTMVSDLLNQPDRSADWSSQNDKSRLESAEDSEEGNKEEEMETQVMGIKCEKCNKKFESVDKLIEHVMEIEHVTEMECLECNEKFKSLDKLIEHMDICVVETYMRKHKKKEHEVTSEEGSKEEENKKDSNEGGLSNQPDRSADYSSQNDRSRLESAEELEEIDTTEKQKVKEFDILEMTDKDTEIVYQEVNDETINNIVAENNEPIVEIPLPGKTLTNNNIENERADLEIKEIVKDKSEVDKTCKENTHLEKESDHNNTENIASENDELNKKIPIENLETDDDNREGTVNDTEEEGLEKDDQNEDSSVISDQSFHPEEDNIEVYDESKKEEFGTLDINESFHNHCQIQVEQ